MWHRFIATATAAEPNENRIHSHFSHSSSDPRSLRATVNHPNQSINLSTNQSINQSIYQAINLTSVASNPEQRATSARGDMGIVPRIGPKVYPSPQRRGGPRGEHRAKQRQAQGSPPTASGRRVLFPQRLNNNSSTAALALSLASLAPSRARCLPLYRCLSRTGERGVGGVVVVGASDSHTHDGGDAVGGVRFEAKVRVVVVVVVVGGARPRVLARLHRSVQQLPTHARTRDTAITCSCTRIITDTITHTRTTRHVGPSRAADASRPTGTGAAARAR